MAKPVDPHAILETLERRRAELDAEIEAVVRFIRICDGERRAARGTTPSRGPAAAVRSPANATRAKPRRQTDRQTATADRAAVVAAVQEILAEGGTPLDRTALLDALTARGIMVGGKRPLANLQNMLWKSKAQIVNLPGHGHWLADRDYPPADYRAGADPR